MAAPARALLRLSRPKFLAGGLAGGALGTALAAFEHGRVDWRAYAFAQGTITAFHLMTHYANDYFDRFGDAGASRTAFSGGSGALVDGTVRPSVVLGAAGVCAALGIAGAASLWLGLHAPLAAGLGVGIGLLAWTYSAPPVRLLASGFGEAETALVVAVLVPLCAFCAQGGAPDALALAATLAGAAAMFAMMLGVEFPDFAVDEATGKRNLLVRLGRAAGLRAGLAATAAIYPAAGLAVACGAPRLYALALALTVPLAIGYGAALRRAISAPAEPAALAGRGVALFFVVSVYGALAFAVAAGVRSEGASAETKAGAAAVERSVVTAEALRARASAALDEVRPGIQRDGGDVWLVRIDGPVAYVQMVGACGGCAMSTSTLRGAIETAILARCPEISSVEQV